MIQKNKTLFFVVLTVLIVALISLTIFFIDRSKEQENQRRIQEMEMMRMREQNENNNIQDIEFNKVGSEQRQKLSTNEPDIVLHNLGISSFSDVDVTTNALREYDSKGLKGFYVFGDRLSGNRLNPNFEYSSLKPNTQIISAIDGIVAFIKDQNEYGEPDHEIIIKPKEDSIWTVAYDHIVNVAVKRGDAVKVGQFLGNPSRQNNRLYRFEIQVNKDDDNQTAHICPAILLDKSIQENQLKELSDMLNSWNTISGKKLYDTSLQNPVGCLTQTLTTSQTEGK